MARLKATCHKFNSMPEFLARVSKIDERHKYNGRHGDTWSATTDAGIRNVLSGGRMESRDAVAAVMDKVDAQVQDRHQREYVAGVAGAFPIVPDYLQGMPMHMRRRAHVASDVAPVRIVVEVGISAGVPVSTIQKRGAAVAALAMRMSETRPVELWTASLWRPGSMRERGKSQDVGVMVKLDVAPLSVADIAAALVEPDYPRGIIFAFLLEQIGVDYMDNNGIPWIFGMNTGDPKRIAKVREFMGLDDADIFLPGGHLYEAKAMVRDPVAWVNKYLDAQRTLDENI